MSEITEAGQRIEAFLRDDAVQAALLAMKDYNYTLFVGAVDDRGRQMAQAQALVLAEFERSMRATVDAGQREIQEQEQRDRALPSR